MDQQELLSVVQKHGHQARKSREEVHIKDCVFCANPNWNLELNAQKGVGHCWACDTGFRLDAFLSEYMHMDVSVPVNLEARASGRREKVDEELEVTAADLTPACDMDSAVRYLGDRGLTMSDIVKYEISVCTNEEHRLYPRLIFPVWEYWTGELLGHIGRTYTNQQPRYLSAMPYLDVVGYREGSWHEVHVLVEGVFDGICVHQAGFQSAMLLGKLGSELEEWAALTDRTDGIVILLDGDARDKAKEYYHRIKPIRNNVWAYLMPEDMDPADFDPEVLRTVIVKTMEGKTENAIG